MITKHRHHITDVTSRGWDSATHPVQVEGLQLLPHAALLVNAVLEGRRHVAAPGRERSEVEGAAAEVAQRRLLHRRVVTCSRTIARRLTSCAGTLEDVGDARLDQHRIAHVHGTTAGSKGSVGFASIRASAAPLGRLNCIGSFRVETGFVMKRGTPDGFGLDVCSMNG